MSITPSQILLPVMVLVAWSMVMWAWMYATRIPAIFKMRMRLDPMRARGDQMNELPAQVRWKADNYNHLMEQPTIFYAITLTMALMGQGQGANLWLAWSYVALRIIHSFVQAMVNVINLRFGLFFISSLLIVALVINALSAYLAML